MHLLVCNLYKMLFFDLAGYAVENKTQCHLQYCEFSCTQHSLCLLETLICFVCAWLGVGGVGGELSFY